MNAARGPAAVAVLLLAGCSGPSAPQAAREPVVLAAAAEGRIVALDAGTQAMVACTGLLERTLADGRIEVVASLRAAEAGPVRVRIGCVFMDDDGRQVGPGAERVVPVAAGASEAVLFDAASPAARSYLLRAALAR